MVKRLKFFESGLIPSFICSSNIECDIIYPCILGGYYPNLLHRPRKLHEGLNRQALVRRSRINSPLAGRSIIHSSEDISAATTTDC